MDSPSCNHIQCLTQCLGDTKHLDVINILSFARVLSVAQRTLCPFLHSVIELKSPLDEINSSKCPSPLVMEWLPFINKNYVSVSISYHIAPVGFEVHVLCLECMHYRIPLLSRANSIACEISNFTYFFFQIHVVLKVSTFLASLQVHNFGRSEAICVVCWDWDWGQVPCLIL